MNDQTSGRRYYFTTRDLLLMAALAALGGVSGTAINAIGDALQATLGISGSLQWAAGLHVLWLVLAVGLTGKGGAGTITGLLKGAVEFLSGNTHGVLILLIDLVAGLLVDVAVFPFRYKDRLLPLTLAGGLATASNVFVFQLFAAAPEDVVRFIWLIAGIALVSGVVLAGGLGYALLQALRRAGVVRDQPVAPLGHRAYPLFLGTMALLAVGAGFYLSAALKGPPTVRIVGNVAAPYEYMATDVRFSPQTYQLQINNMTRQFTGVPLREIIAVAQPDDTVGAALVSATDGYSFFITRDEIEQSDTLILAHRGAGDDLSYEVAGAENSKAWVRNVQEIRLVAQALVVVRGAVDRPFPYNPADWQMEMENGQLDLGQGTNKYQGMSLAPVLDKWQPQASATELVLVTASGQSATLSLDEARRDEGWRLWSVNTAAGMTFAVAHDDGRVLATDVVAIEVR